MTEKIVYVVKYGETGVVFTNLKLVWEFLETIKKNTNPSDFIDFPKSYNALLKARKDAKNRNEYMSIYSQCNDAAYTLFISEAPLNHIRDMF